MNIPIQSLIMLIINRNVIDSINFVVIQLKTETIKKLNDVTLVNFEKNLDKIGKIKEEFE